MTLPVLLLLLAGVPVLLAAGYLLTLTLLARPHAGRVGRSPWGRRYRILVPAHNEELGLPATLASLRTLDTSLDSAEVVVIADNCTDRTAEVARAAGVRVLERHDPLQRGKGHALAFGIASLLTEPVSAWDALIVIDADTIVQPNLLRAVARRLGGGADAVQVTYLPRHQDAGALAIITDVAFTAFHVVRSAARERLGLSAGLRGNGMAFRRAVLAAVSHDAFSRTEDLEFGIRLGLAGVRVAHAGDTTVFGDMPAQAAVVSQQRSRWIGGRAEIARTWLPTLVAAAIRRRSLLLADLAIDLLVPPLSLLTLAALGGLMIALLAVVTGVAPVLVLLPWLGATIALVIHVLDAAHRAGQLLALLRASTTLPGYALGKAGIALRELRTGDTAWIRTARLGEMP